jgi:hypothetical protein
MRTGLVGVIRGTAVVCLLGIFGCQTPTSFEGEAKFPGGPRGCFDRCASQQMDMASFVYVGEYSTACACQPRHASGAATSSNERVSAAVVAAAAGAEMQRRRIQQQQQSAAMNASHPAYVPH